METFQNHIDGYPPTFSLYRKSLCDANSSTNLVLNLSISFHLDLSALLNACHMPLLWCPYGLNCPGRIFFQKLSLFGHFDRFSSTFCIGFNCLFQLFLSITCATVGKTKFLTRHLRLGT